MTVWNELEPLLGKVQKPARYIGCEDGAQAPEHHSDAAAWFLAYPEGKDVMDDVRPDLFHLAVVGPTDNGIKIEAHLATHLRGLRISELVTVLDPTREVRPGTANHPLHAARRRPVRAPSGALRCDVGAARPGACVMRRDRTHDRHQHRRPPGRTRNQRIGGFSPVV